MARAPVVERGSAGDVDSLGETQHAPSGDDGKTLPLSGGGPPSGADPSLAEHGFAARYATVDALGAGGMGEVVLCRDRRVGREIAMKRIRREWSSDAGVRARFVLEARVQGSLEHPAVVPVYDLGLTAEGEAYFTMKRVRGTNLEQVLASLAAGDPTVERAYFRRKLLTALAQVCLAVELAHGRGLVHRDLKPGNVMFGDFGEVYVLDWGLAKVPGALAALPSTGAPLSQGKLTSAGSMLGTPGYMAPEQARGEELDARADVYALGAILFEILTLRPLHEGSTGAALIASALAGADAHASSRAPDRDVPPELEAAWERATALDPRDRLSSA